MTSFDDGIDGFLVAQTDAGLTRIRNVRLDRIGIQIVDDRDAALRVLSRGVRRTALADREYFQSPQEAVRAAVRPATPPPTTTRSA